MPFIEKFRPETHHRDSRTRLTMHPTSTGGGGEEEDEGGHTASIPRTSNHSTHSNLIIRNQEIHNVANRHREATQSTTIHTLTGKEGTGAGEGDEKKGGCALQRGTTRQDEAIPKKKKKPTTDCIQNKTSMKHYFIIII